jgi:ligand-binding sensor domain-containing protein
VSDGLPDNRVTSVLQTQDGYLWVASFSGVARFDGARFVEFNLIHRAAVEGNVAKVLLEARDGSLWIGTRDGLVNYHNGHFTAITTRQGLSDSSVSALCLGSDGSLWVGTRRGGLNRIRDGKVTALDMGSAMSNNEVRALVEDRQGTLWVGSASGLSRVRSGLVSSVSLGTGQTAPSIASLHIGRQGSLWIGTSAGLWLMPPARRGLTDQVVPIPAFAGRDVLALCEEEDGTVWVGTASGLAKMNRERVEFSTDGTLARGAVQSLTIDREGSLWVGTDGEGLSRLRKASVVMRSSDSAPSNRLTAVYRDVGGTMWTASACGGVTRWDSSGTTAFGTRQGLPNECVRALAGGPDGTLWIGTDGGLARLRDGRITSYGLKDGLSNLLVMAVTVDKAGSVWVGTGGSGLDRFSGDRFVNYSSANGLTHNDIRAIAEGPDGTIWIATMGGGLNRWRRGVLDHITRADGLSSNYVLALLIDKDGTVWVGTEGGGLDRVRSNGITHYTSLQGLPSDDVFQILDDGRGNLWMSCGRGIFWVARSEFEEVTAGLRSRLRAGWLGHAEGLRPATIEAGGQPSGAIDAAGRLWFPTMNGAAIVDPGRLVLNNVAPQVHIERVLVDRHEVAFDQLATIPAGRHAFEFDCTALSFVAPTQVQFRYQLKGLSDEWVDVGSRRTVYFNNLRHGTYRFQIQASNSDHVWNVDGAVVEFTVLPRFYETIWFYILTTAFGTWLVWVVHRLRIRRLRIRQEELSHEVEEALAEIKILSGLLPICASCKRIRDDSQAWRPLESYIRDHSQAKFSHGICPECMKKLYPEYVDDPGTQ